MQLVFSWPVIVASATALVVLAVFVVIGLINDVPMRLITRDIADIGDVHVFYGVLSSFGAFLWCSSASVWLFTASRFLGSGLPHIFRFLLFSGLLSLFLLFDDFFQFHEFLAPEYLKLKEEIVYGLLLMAVVSYLVLYRTLIFSVRYGPLVAALWFLAASVVFDVLQPWMWPLREWQFILEDGLKWVGIANWLAFAIAASSSLLSAYDVPSRKRVGEPQ